MLLFERLYHLKSKRDRLKFNWGRGFLKKTRPQLKFNLSLFELCNFGIHFEKGKLAGILDIINEICYNSDTYKSR